MMHKRNDDTPFNFTYTRTPTTAKLRVTFPNGDTFDVPAQVIADDRDENYASDEKDTVGFIRAKQLDAYDLTDWAISNQNWSDLAPHAVKVDVPPKKINYNTEWVNAQTEIVGDI